MKAVRKKKPTPTKPGVIAAIVEVMSRPTGATADEILAALVRRFPDREPEKMRATIKTQAQRQATRKERDDGLVRYFISRRAA